MAENVVDLGHIDKARTLRHTFVLRNISDETLSLRVVKPSCNCIRVFLEKKEASRNESVAIRVEYRPDISDGYFDKSVTVIISGCKKPLVLRLRGFVEDTAKPKRN